jgi:hypothetical protein
MKKKKKGPFCSRYMLESQILFWVLKGQFCTEFLFFKM